MQNSTESFRLYRKKAKEIFEAQQQSTGGGGPSSVAMGITSNSSADAKLSYLKNLMMNYFTADPSVRDHMLAAIGTVLQFTPEEQKRIVAKKATQDSSSWF
jgi:GRIP domain